MTKSSISFKNIYNILNKILFDSLNQLIELFEFNN